MRGRAYFSPENSRRNTPLYRSQPLEAAAAAVCAMGLAGEIAHARLTPLDGNATYRNYIIDAIYNTTPEQLEKGANYEVR